MHADVGEALAMIFAGIDKLKSCCEDGRRFAVDGRLVGDIGELIAARDFDVRLDAKSRKDHDGCLSSEPTRLVQVKATFKDHLSFMRTPMLYLGLKLYRDGRYDVVFNGPGMVLAEAFGHRKDIGEKLLMFPISRMRALSASVDDADRVPARTSRPASPKTQAGEGPGR